MGIAWSQMVCYKPYTKNHMGDKICERPIVCRCIFFMIQTMLWQKSLFMVVGDEPFFMDFHTFCSKRLSCLKAFKCLRVRTQCAVVAKPQSLNLSQPKHFGQLIRTNGSWCVSPSLHTEYISIFFRQIKKTFWLAQQCRSAEILKL
jgi:hypothetical protein